MIHNETDPKGYLSIVLHAHLPFVRHPEQDYMIEEKWLFEAITETYIPLLATFGNLADDNVPFRITMSLTPPLCAMLTDTHLQGRYVRHVERLIGLAENETVRTRNEPAFYQTALMYLEKFKLCRHVFTELCGRDLVKAFRDLQDKGNLEIITCGATHGFLPTMQLNKKAVRAQILIAADSYERYFGRKPQGIWLPECGYFPGVEKYLQEVGIRYFFTDTHGILFAEPRPKYGVFAPVFCKGTQVAAFGRDIESSKAVWCSKVGYPGDFAYRDFYRDIGFDLDIDYILPYIDPIGNRLHTGIKYYKITGKTNEKKPYNYTEALNRAFVHAGNFLFNREKQVGYLRSIMDRRPIIVAPYDAELFGHWWYEGPNWLNFLIRKIAFEQNAVQLITPSEYLAEYPTNQVCEPCLSSWGQKGYSEVWLESSNDWIYRHLHSIEETMVESANRYPNAKGLLKRTLNQMARELLLAESSDWAFIMKTGTMVEYAVRRTREHIANFLSLHNAVRTNSINENFISLLEHHNNIFPHIDYKIYS
jgi:1,4-alpha-glucan branching enzyme